ncbi:MAG TPA: nucleoside deaminase [Ilumatobacter sp.]|nr:nucleoside deaminase [Ilumatobacter sp.]
MTAARSFAELPHPMQLALQLGWESVVAGSLGIGAVVVNGSGDVVATGRNRLHETDPGDDLIAGSSLAHAEINALAKLGYWQHEADELELFTTLQPCLQCLGAIRLSPVRRVHILAADPLWRGLEALRDIVPFVTHRWPDVHTMANSPWAVWSLLTPTAHILDRSKLRLIWEAELPAVVTLVERMRAADVFARWVAERPTLVEAADEWWPDLQFASRPESK